VAEYTGTYTASDYLDILEHLMRKWKVSSRTGEPSLSTPPKLTTHAARVPVAPLDGSPFPYARDVPLLAAFACYQSPLNARPRRD